MISEKLLKKLNEQMMNEFYSANLYLQMSAWCNHEGFEGSAKFLRNHAAEEMEHMQKLFDYIQDIGALPIIDAIEKPKSEYKDLKHVFETAYKHEKLVTSRIHELVELSLSEKDFRTFNFLQWYVEEQREEEKLFKSILDKINMVGLEGRGLFIVDREIGSMKDKEIESIKNKEIESIK